MPRFYAFIAVLIFATLMWLYVKEFAVFSNTLEVKALVFGSMFCGFLICSGLLWWKRERFSPWERHYPGVLLILVFSMVFSPLFASLMNRASGETTSQAFEFVSETGYYASGYGVLKGEKLRPTGWRLTVKRGPKTFHFKYKTQAYFPLTKPGESVLLPIQCGIFNIQIMHLY